jgi:hypothetical protein
MDDPPLLSACMDHARDTLTCGPRLEWLEQVVPSGHDWGTDGQDLLEPARKIGSNAALLLLVDTAIAADPGRPRSCSLLSQS